jgi:hypothetical protein
MKTGINETTDVVIAVLDLLTSHAKAKADDGKVSRTEAIGILLGNTGSIWTAVNGISEVPAELKDLDAEELDFLFATVLGSMAWERTEDTESIVRAVYDSVRQLLSTVRRIQNTIHPPKAEVVG